MSAAAIRSNGAKKVFRRGDDIGLQLGPQYVHGTVVEDRGPIASKGHHLLLVKVDMGYGVDLDFEMPDDLLEKFPADDPIVASAYKAVEDAISGYKDAISEDEESRKHLQTRRTGVRGAYRKLLWALKESAPGGNLEALEASIPANLVTDVNIALGKEIPPKINDV